MTAKNFEHDKMIEKTGHRVHSACAETCDEVTGEKYAKLGNAVRAALETLKQEIIALCRSAKESAKLEDGEHSQIRVARSMLKQPWQSGKTPNRRFISSRLLSAASYWPHPSVLD